MTSTLECFFHLWVSSWFGQLGGASHVCCVAGLVLSEVENWPQSVWTCPWTTGAEIHILTVTDAAERIEL
jgi:hypothetical protein